MQWKSILFIIVTSAIGICSCQSHSEKIDIPTINKDDIIGKWDLMEAKRNGKITESLADAYLQFDTAENLTTNLFGATAKQQVSWQDSTVTVADSSVSYHISTLESDTLMLSFDIQRYLFDLTFVRALYNDSLSTYAPLGAK